MLPRLAYEWLPWGYGLLAAGLLLLADHPLLWLAGCLLYMAASTIWVLRSTHRRTTMARPPRKTYLLSHGLYEFKPFIGLALGLLFLRHALFQEQWLFLIPSAWLLAISLFHLRRRAHHRQGRRRQVDIR